MRKMVVAMMLIVLLVCGFGVVALAGSSNENDWVEYIEQVCAERHICPELVEAIIETESSWDPQAVNGTCIGLMQINQTYHWTRMQKLGVTDLADPYENILVGVDILSDLFARYQDPAAVLMFYNAGYSEVCGLGAYNAGHISGYAVRILERAAELERLHGK